jgi:hypothetical protein
MNMSNGDFGQVRGRREAFETRAEKMRGRDAKTNEALTPQKVEGVHLAGAKDDVSPRQIARF